MHFNALRRQMPALLDSGVSIELISAPGRGKSEFVADTVETMSKRDGSEWGFATLFLATMTPTDLLGYMVPEKRSFNGSGEALVSSFTMPPWMLTRDGVPVTHFRRGILFLDEFGQGEPDVKRAAAELLLNRRLGPWALPRGWSVIAASNRASDRSGVTKSYDFVINRRIQVDISDDLQSWEDWAFQHGLDPLYIAFANQNPQIVFSDGVPEKQEPWCTPRSLVMCERILKRGNEIATDPDSVELATGMIGAGAAAQLFAFIRLGQEMPKYDEIVKSPKQVKVPGKPDAQMLVCYSLAARVSAQDAEPIVTYIERMPKEFAVTFAKAACKRDFSLVNTPTFSAWCAKNSSLMTAIVDAK